MMAKYGQCVTGALDVLVIDTVSDGLDEQAQGIRGASESPRPHALQSAAPPVTE